MTDGEAGRPIEWKVLWRLRAFVDSSMRAKLCPYILASFVCAQLGSTAAFAAAHPTHTLARENRRLVLPAPAHESQHARGAHQAAHSHGSQAAKAGHVSHHAAAETKHGSHERREASNHAKASPAKRRSKTRQQAARGSNQVDTTTAADRATAERVHAWERHQAQTSTGARPSTAEQALEAAGAQIAATEITPAEALSPTMSPASGVELPRISTIEQEAATPMLLPSLYDKRGRLVVPAPLYGSHDVLVHQNQMADHDGLTRVRDDDDLNDLRREHKLVPLPDNEAVHVDDRLPLNRRYSRPWTAVFLAVLSRDFYASFHEPLQLTSAVRTVQIQQRLLHTNGNAAPIAGETASPHLTGQAIDIGKRGLTMPQIAWMRAYLEPLIQAGKIDVEEEFQQSCFHISVYRSYTTPVRESLATTGLPRSSASY